MTTKATDYDAHAIGNQTTPARDRFDSASDFVDYANDRLRQRFHEHQIGPDDIGDYPCCYTISDDGLTVFNTDCNDNFETDWQTETDVDIDNFAEAYINLDRLAP